MKAEVTLFTEITVEESATVSGGDAAADLIKAQFDYLKSNSIQIAPGSAPASTPSSTPSSTPGAGSGGTSGGSSAAASVNALANPVVKLPFPG